VPTSFAIHGKAFAASRLTPSAVSKNLGMGVNFLIMG